MSNLYLPKNKNKIIRKNRKVSSKNKNNMDDTRKKSRSNSSNSKNRKRSSSNSYNGKSRKGSSSKSYSKPSNNKSRKGSFNNSPTKSSNSKNNKNKSSKLSIKFGRKTRLGHSIFIPKRLQIGGKLGKCWIIEEILTTPCEERLQQQRYYDITNQKTIFFSRPAGQLTYSITTSIISHLINNQGENVCTGGRIQLYLQGNPAKYNTRNNNIVIPEATTVNFKFPKQCNDINNTNLIFIPLDIQWISSKSGIQEAKRRGEEFHCHNNCVTGHAAAIIINIEDQTIDFFDSNGKNTSYYRPIADYLTQLFANTPQFQDYVIAESPGCLPNYGPQTIAQIPQCVLFANLYAVLRLLCDDIKPEIIIQELINLGQDKIINLLQHFYCFLIEYGQDNGIFQAADYLEEIYSQVQNKLLNFHIYGRNTKYDQQYYENQVHEAELAAFNDILKAIKILRKVDKQLKW